MGCVFCDIVAGKIPARKIYENEDVLAFYDSNPQAPVHFLVIFKQHIENVAKLEGEQFSLVGEVFKAISKVAEQLNLSSGFRVVNNCGEKAGQTVKHVHFHVLSGRNFSWPPG